MCHRDGSRDLLQCRKKVRRLHIIKSTDQSRHVELMVKRYRYIKQPFYGAAMVAILLVSQLFQKSTTQGPNFTVF